MNNTYRLGIYTLTGLVIANMIGAGVFTTSGFAIGDLGSPAVVLLAWLVGGGLAVCGALSYGALARLLPVSGGEYLFLSRAMHPMAGFIAGWVSLLAGFTGAIAYAAITFEAYLLPQTWRDALPQNLFATLIIVLSAVAHGLHIRHGAWMQNLVVGFKLILISGFFLFVLLAVPLPEWDGLQAWQQSAPVPFSIHTFAMTLMWISFSYAGFNAAVYIAGEAADAVHILPRSMLYGTLLTMLIYLVLNAIFVFAPSPELIAYKEDVAAIAAMSIGGESLALLVRIIICAGLFTSVSAMIMIGPRVYAQMAEDSLLPGWLRLRGEVPTAAILMQAVLAIIVVWISTLRDLLSYLGFTLSLSSVIAVASLFIIVRRGGHDTSRLTGYPWAPAIYIVFTLLFAGLAAMREPWQMVAALVTLASGAIVYSLMKRA